MDGDTARVLLIVYVPVEAADDVRSALAAAGAGRIGNYAGCSFSARGVGRFRPMEGANPAVGTVGEAAEVDEERIEAVVERSALPMVVRAVRDAHPYEEPVILLTPLLDVKHLSSPHPHLTPDDFEVGEDVTTEFTIGPNPGIQLAVRLSLEEARKLQAIARKEGKSLTQVAREALLATIAASASPTASRT